MENSGDSGTLGWKKALFCLYCVYVGAGKHNRQGRHYLQKKRKQGMMIFVSFNFAFALCIHSSPSTFLHFSFLFLFLSPVSRVSPGWWLGGGWVVRSVPVSSSLSISQTGKHLTHDDVHPIHSPCTALFLPLSQCCCWTGT